MQIPLDIKLPVGFTFENFIVGPNSQLVDHCVRLSLSAAEASQPMTFIHGDTGVGKSHLSMAICHNASENGLSAVYLAVKDVAGYSADILNGLEYADLVCIDDIHLLEGSATWQRGLFDLINRSREKSGCQLIFTANAGPKQLPLSLPDLASRLTWGISYGLIELSDLQRADAIIIKAKNRGITINDDVARFLITHLPQDMSSLTSTLDTLDKTSLQEKRAITIPFVKKVLSI